MKQQKAIDQVFLLQIKSKTTKFILFWHDTFYTLSHFLYDSVVLFTTTKGENALS